MRLDDVVERMRPLMIVVDRTGRIHEAHGGFGGTVGIDPATLPGTTVFDHLTDADATDLAAFFLGDAVGPDDLTPLPLPLRVSLIDAEGIAHPVDVLPSGGLDETGDWRWVVVLVPVVLTGSISRSFDLAMGGASRDEVRRMLCRELRVDTSTHTSRWLLVDLHDPELPTVTAAHEDDHDLADAAQLTIVAHRWRPWDGLGPEVTEPIDAATFPDPIGPLVRERGWKRALVAPIHVDGVLAGAWVMVGRVPPSFPVDVVRSGHAVRVQSLVRATSMLMTHWRDQDRLTLAATVDSLTGVANRAAFFDHLEARGRHGAVLYVDVDDFKAVNDRFGHLVGDRVLAEVARRLVSVCRSDDVVARLGGDEFAVLLRRATADVGREIARRMVDAVGAPLDVPGGPERVSVSIGLSMVSVGDAALDAADRAMLVAKRRGRGQVEMALASR